MPDVSIADLPAQIALALSLASSSTGADFHYLLNTARTESSFQTEAKAPTSSAQGLFQFIEETWIRTIKDEGERYGLGKYAAWITKTSAGRYVVDTAEHRTAILKLRNNAKISAMMAAAYANQNEDFVRSAIGRTPTSDELYIAHFLGPADAVRLINYRDSAPSFSAPDLFPAAAKANRPIFYGEAGPRSVGQVYDVLASREHGGTATTAANDGAFFSSGIDFGSWSPTVEKIYTTKVKAQRPVEASAETLSVFDFFTGKPSPAADEAQADVKPGDSWGANVEAAPTVEVPYITVANDYPASGAGLLGTDTPVAASLPSQPQSAPVRVAAANELQSPRLKIIHVPQQ